MCTKIINHHMQGDALRFPPSLWLDSLFKHIAICGKIREKLSTDFPQMQAPNQGFHILGEAKAYPHI